MKRLILLILLLLCSCGGVNESKQNVSFYIDYNTLELVLRDENYEESQRISFDNYKLVYEKSYSSLKDNVLYRKGDNYILVIYYFKY